MNRLKAIICALLAAVAVFTLFGGTVFAEAVSGSDLDGMMHTMSTEVSDSDAFVVTPADAVSTPLSGYELKELDARAFGVKMLVPDLKNSLSPESDAETVKMMFDEGATVADLFDMSNGYSTAGFNYIYIGVTDDDNCNVMVTYSDSTYAKYIGSYASLSAEEQERLRDSTSLLSEGAGPVQLRDVNGVPFLYQEEGGASGISFQAIQRTIVKGGIYDIMVYIAQPTAEDIDMADEIFKSVRVSGFDLSDAGVASTAAVTWLAVLVGVLFVAVLLLAFFLVRFALHAKAAGSSFSIIGFDLPRTEKKADSMPDYDATREM